MGKYVWIVGLYVMACWSLVHAQGYRMEEDRIVVEEEDWKAWDHPKGVLGFDDEGELKPRFVRKNINACADALQFGGGLWEAGTNPSDVVNVMDGDMRTFWEPSREDSLRTWWFEMDLGRAVSATKLVLKFVEEGLGDPFLQFRVGVCNGFKAWDAQPFYYETAGKTAQPNESQRVFEFSLSLPAPSGSDSKEVPGDVVRFVRIQVTDSRGDRREKILKEEYASLNADWRGAVEYYRITEAGEERLVTEEVYAELSPEQQGSVRYYRQELPRLAEVEVWSLGENLSLGILDRGGGVETPQTFSSQPIDGFDGDLMTGQRLDMKTWIVVDLGVLLWLDTVRLAVKKPRVLVTGYRVNISDGTQASGDDLSWTIVSPEARWENIDETSPGIIRYPYRDYVLPPGHPFPEAHPSETLLHYFGETFGPFKVRFLKFQGNHINYGMYLHEAHIFGDGYVPEMPLTSGIIEVGNGRKLNSVEWISDTPPGTSVFVQTRTGDTLAEKKRYFDASGNEITGYRWKHKLPGFMRGPIKIEYLPGGNWSPWSRPYEHSGDLFQSPSPKKYLQIRVKLLSNDPYQAASLKSLSIPFSTPLTESIRGTMSPQEVQRLGAPELFTLKIHPLLQEWHPGFNQLLIQTLDRMEMELVKMEVKKDSTSADLTDQVEILPTHPDSLWMVLPDTIQAGDAEEIEIQFLSALYQDSTPFNVFVGNSSLPGVWQQVESEDFHPFLHTFIVFVPLDKKMIDNVEIVPTVLTPNGDGVNDVMTIHFTVGRIEAPREVRVTIYDLEGRSVRHIVERREKYPLGKYTMQWDGWDDGGELVDPGMYVVVIRVHSNWEEARNTEVRRRVVVVY